MIALSFVFCLAVSLVSGASDPFAAWGAACIRVSNGYPTNDRMSGWKGSGDTDIRGYYKKISNTLYKKVNDINCKDIQSLEHMWFKKSGSTYTLNPTRSGSRYKNCKVRTPFASFKKALCDAPGNGPAPTKPMCLWIDSAAASKCNTMWATTNYADGLILDAPQDYVSPVDEDGFFDQYEQLDDDEVDDIFGDEIDDQPELDAPVFDDEFEQQPKLAAPTFEKPAGDAFTVTIGKWTMLIATLVMANFAIFMTILYCKEKNKASAKYTEQF